ncbi:MAG: class I SAM-dependent methyltransferase [Bifidobacteriaceae bacterium]|nr:class I SAM-dependent methyltransferase [Bifidobacteriaceae bacterium]
MTTADLAKEPRTVAAMFDTVAPNYDFADAVMTVGLIGWWRRRTLKVIRPAPGERILDLAAGTCSSSIALAKRDASVVACDFSEGMLRQGRQRVGGRVGQLSLIGGDGTRLPFADETFDKVTVSFGLRNVQDVPKALTELRRVTKPGGKLVICEFSRPVWRPYRALYRWYLSRVMPALAKLVASNSPAYGYLADSIWAWADQQELERQLEQAGWASATHSNMMGGIVALHSAAR